MAIDEKSAAQSEHLAGAEATRPTAVSPPSATGNDALVAPTHDASRDTPEHQNAQGIAEVPPPTYGNVTGEHCTTGDAKTNGPQHVSPEQAPPPPAMVIPLTSLARESAMVDCPRCRQAVQTSTEKHSGSRAMLMGGVICCLLSPLCAWIPCVMGSCKDVEHFCPHCRLLLAVVDPSNKVAQGPQVAQLLATESGSANARGQYQTEKAGMQGGTAAAQGEQQSGTVVGDGKQGS